MNKGFRNTISKKAMIQKDFVFYNVRFGKKRNKKPIFEMKVPCLVEVSTFKDLLAYVFGDHLGNYNCVAYFNSDKIRFSRIGCITGKKDEYFFLDDNIDAYHAIQKSTVIKGEEMYYALKAGKRIQYLNNSFREDIYLKNEYEMTIDLEFDEKGYKEALNNPDYEPQNREEAEKEIIDMISNYEYKPFYFKGDSFFI